MIWFIYEAVHSSDLKNWGYIFYKDSNKPYFVGHVRQDEILDRYKYVAHFLK